MLVIVVVIVLTLYRIASGEHWALLARARGDNSVMDPHHSLHPLDYIYPLPNAFMPKSHHSSIDTEGYITKGGRTIPVVIAPTDPHEKVVLVNKGMYTVMNHETEDNTDITQQDGWEYTEFRKGERSRNGAAISEVISLSRWRQVQSNWQSTIEGIERKLHCLRLLPYSRFVRRMNKRQLLVCELHVLVDYYADYYCSLLSATSALYLMASAMLLRRSFPASLRSRRLRALSWLVRYLVVLRLRTLVCL